MTFLNPLLLWGMLGAGIPVIIHLWGRRRPRRTPFPSLRLIRAGQQQQRSFSRLREWLILLLRMLLVILASLALAGPTVDSWRLAWLAPPEQRAVVVIDRSASMGYRQGGETSCDRAKRALRTIESSLPANVTLSAFTLDRELKPLKPDGRGTLIPGSGRARVIERLNHATESVVWDSRSRVFLVTDLQESGLRGELVSPFDQPPIVVDVGAEKPSNRAVIDAVASTVCPLRGRPISVEVRIRAWGQPSGTKPPEVTATADGHSVPGQTASGQGGYLRARLQDTARTSGETAWEIATPPDAMPVDDVYHCVVPVRDRLRVSVLTEESDPRLFSLALDPGGQAETRVEVSVDRLSETGNLIDADVYVLTDTRASSPMLRSAATAAGDGRGVILFTGPRTEVSAELLRDLLGAPVRLGPTVAAPVDQPFRLAEVDTLSSALAPFAAPRSGDLRAFSFRRRREIENGESARVPARFSDGTPAILGTLLPDRRCILVNTTLDARWTDAPYQPAYVPLMHRLCYDVAGPAARVWVDWFAGELMRVAMPRGADGPAQISGPGGLRVTVEAKKRRWEFVPPGPGLYEVTWQESGATRTARFSANISPAESDLTRIGPAELQRRLKAPQAAVVKEGDLAEYLRTHSLSRVGLAWPLLVLGLIVLIAETILSAPGRMTDEEVEVST